MRKILPLALVCACSYGAFAVTFPIFDPFADATASGGTSYSDGSPLKNQINATGNTWIPVNTNQSSLIPLTAYAFSNYAVGAPWPAPSGNVAGQVNAPGSGSGQGVRMNLTDFATNGISNGTVYASMYIRCTDISTLNPYAAGTALGGGIFHMAFNDGVGSTGTLPSTQLCGRWYFRKSQNDAGQNRLYNIGVSKVNSSTGGNPTAYWDPRDFTTDQELFVVVGYSFNSLGGTNDDTAKLWVNPDPATFGQTTEPTAPVQGGTSPADGDAKFIASFNILSRNTTQVTSMLFDEVRIGTNWAQVTSTNSVVIQPIIQPTLTASIINPTTVQLSWGTNSTGFTLQGTSTLLTTNTPWSNVGGSASVSGTNYIQTDAISGTKFYRLKQ